MYSYEERIRAVELYIKLGKRVAATVRQLGYPTKNALKGWHREFELRQDLPVGYARSRPKYSPEQKKLAVDHYLDHGRCIALTIKTLGYPGQASLQAWIQELRPEAHSRVVGRSGRASAVLKRTAVIALCTREESAQAIADRLGVCRPTLYNWKHELLGIEVSASMKRKRIARGSRAGGVRASTRSAATRGSTPTTATRPSDEGERNPKKRHGHHSAIPDQQGEDIAD